MWGEILAGYIGLLAVLPWVSHWFHRRAQWIEPGDCFEIQGWIFWGYFASRLGVDPFLVVRLPSYSWGFSPQFNEYRMGQRMLIWVRSSRPRMHYYFN